MAFPLKLGSQGDLVSQLDRVAVARYKSYAHEIDGVTPLKDDKYYGRGEQRFAQTWQANMHRPPTGEITEDEFNYIVKNIAFPVTRKLKPGWWIYTCPGSGARGDVGPSFEVGKFAEEVLGIRHQWVYFAMGGYLGLMGGDSSLSYNAVIFDQYKSIEWLLDNNPDVQRAMQMLNDGASVAQVKAAIDLTLIFSGYSQSADGLEDALEILFGDGGFTHRFNGQTFGEGKYKALRPFLRLIINFGNPSKQKDKDGGAPGWNPGGWGIARKIRPAWLKRIVVSITNPKDFYAVVPDSDDIRPPFYGEITQSSAQLPYFAHLLSIGIQVALGALPVIGPLLGSFGPMATQILGMGAGLSTTGMSLLGGLMGDAGQAKYDTDIDAKLVALLSVQGIFTHIDDLIGLVMALPGLQNHGMYHVPFPELGNRSGQQVGCDLLRMLVEGKL